MKKIHLLNYAVGSHCEFMIVSKIVGRALIGCRSRRVTSSAAFIPSQSKNRKYQQDNRRTSEMKYILVTGGVISGVGKGVIASSFGTLLNCVGISVTSLKIDPYINIDAGTFSPYEHVSP